MKNSFLNIGIIIIIATMLFSCNSKRNDTNTTQEPESSVSENIVFVNSNKTYFYDEANETTKRKAFLVKGDSIKVLEEKKMVLFIQFLNIMEKKQKDG